MAVFWCVCAIFESPDKESVVVQAAAIIAVSVSVIGTGVGTALAMFSLWDRRPNYAYQAGCLPMIALILNGLSFVIWLCLVWIMFVAQFGDEKTKKKWHMTDDDLKPYNATQNSTKP